MYNSFMVTWQQIVDEFQSDAHLNHPMSKVTTLEIGGPAKFLINTYYQETLLETIRFAKKHDLPFLVIGSGSNLLVSDQPLDLLVIRNNNKGIDQKEDIVIAKGGTLLQELVDFSVDNGLEGFQRMTGIPGTVAGAVYGNAGAYGQTISDHLESVLCYDPIKDKNISLTREQCQFEYRDSVFKTNGLIIISATFKLLTVPKGDLMIQAQETLEARQKKYHPGIKCPGSFFKNVLSETLSDEVKAMIPHYQDTFGKIPAWVFLNEVGALGKERGKIKIADFHSNLFMNTGGGTADDFWHLAKEYADKVKDKFGIQLEPEVQLVNLPPL